MKNSFKKYVNKIVSLAVVTVLLAGCSEYFDNPLKDKETGDDINLLLVDFNFFTTRMTFKLYDAKDSSLITSTAEISFSGKNGDDIVTFAGEKKTIHSTTQGQMELTADPNVDFSTSSPLEFAVNVDIDGYNSLSKGFQINTTGKKTFELYLLNKSDEEESDIEGGIEITGASKSATISKIAGTSIKSASTAGDYEIKYLLSVPNLSYIVNMEYENGSVVPFESVDDIGTLSVIFTVSKYSAYNEDEDVIYNEGAFIFTSFHKLETGSLVSLKINGYKVTNLNGAKIKVLGSYAGDADYDLFGFTDFDTDDGAWYFNEPSSDLKDTVLYETLNFSYTLARASSEGLCGTGSDITFSSSVISSFSIDADVLNSDGVKIKAINFKGNFPETFTVENAKSAPVKLVFRDNNPSFNKIPDLEIDNFCTGDYSVSVTPASGYEQYQVVLRALCPDNMTVGVAPTYSGEIKIKGSSEPWQGIDMIGGKVDILAKPDQEYEMRLLWDSEWEYATFSTIFNESDGSYAGPDYADTEITSEYIENKARIKVNVRKKFSQSICDDMGW
ncbi:hypothetical protein GM418_01420 [Maribellus comscasis]|uniref:Uncharacterized protein n=1 Tax=Maribellus comscasis TaxID=2681766 RepID=A0A6I6JN06_9BACT|nr:hypothetical protein [Maribellus comscasis]QGY42360.1 hypothetical protein GM418_01420 [Maribellus comscasis]